MEELGADGAGEVFLVGVEPDEGSWERRVVSTVRVDDDDGGREGNWYRSQVRSSG